VALLGPLVGRAVLAEEPVVIDRVEAPIEIDGRLDEPVWAGRSSLSEFFETEPGDATAAPVSTEVWLAYDDESLYIGIRAFEPNPDQIVASYRPRDRIDETDDFVSIYLDSAGDRLSAIELRVNPRGSRLDAIWDETSFNDDVAPDFFYEVAATVGNVEWSAEFRIPWSSLRYRTDSKEAWGILVRRSWPRAFRYVLDSSPIPRGSNCFLCHMRPLAAPGDVPSAGHLVAAPYLSLSGGGERDVPGDASTRFEYDQFDVDGGGDLKWAPWPNHVVDLTVYPDFSQIESDVAQLEANRRFALFFPEQRPFFLEGTALFSMPLDGADTKTIDTRTIASPRGGGRATGRFRTTSYTALAVQDRGGGSTILPGPDFSTLALQDFQSTDTIARVRQPLGRSHVGALFADRELFDGAHGYNRVFGPDLLWRLGSKDRLEGQFLWSESETPNRPDLAAEWDGRRLSGHAVDVEWNHQTRTIDWSAGYRDIGPEFRIDSGFLPQVGIREGSGSLGYKLYPSAFVTRIRPLTKGSYTTDRGGSVVSWFAVPGLEVSGRWNSLAIVELNHGAVRVGPDRLERTNGFFFFQVDPFRHLARINVNGNVGEEIDFANGRVGDGVRLSAGVTLRPSDRSTVEALWNRQWLDVEAAERTQRLFTEQTLRLKLTYSFTERLFLRLIGEYVRTKRDPALFLAAVERRSGGFQASALLTYEINWQTRIDLGYQERDFLTTRDALEPDGRTAFLKISYAFQM